MRNDELTKRRLNVATDFWKIFKCPQNINIEDADGFEYSTGENTFTRNVYIHDEEEMGVKTPSKKVSFSVEFKPETTCIESATLDSRPLEIPAKFSSKSSYDKKTLTGQVEITLSEVESLGKMLDTEMEDGNFHSDEYTELAKLINQAIKSVEVIRDRI